MKIHGLITIILIMVIAVSGCVQNFDATQIAKTSAAAKRFLEDYPNAKITASLFEGINIQEDCQNEALEIKDYWKVIMEDPDIQENIIAWIDIEHQVPVCIIRAERIVQKINDLDAIEQQGRWCEDTDNGDDQFTQGECTNYLGESGKDYCTTDGNYLIEFYCHSSGEIISSGDFCPDSQVCLDGACVTEGQGTWCNETDSGEDFYTAGNCADSTGDLIEDICIDRNILREATCYEYQEGKFDCGVVDTRCVGHRCGNGACLKDG